MKLCSSCVAHPSLKKFIEEKGTDIQICGICCAADTKILTKYTREFKQLFKALIRYYHSEWEYNSHFGGEPLESLFCRPSKIINWYKGIDEDELENAILPLIDKVYEDVDEGISLFAGYDSDGNNYPLLEAFGDLTYRSLALLLKQLHHKNYFLLEGDAQSLLTRLEPEITNEISTGEEFYRARIGFSLKGRPEDWSSNPKPDYCPYSGAEIGSPPPLDSSAGRLNRHGTSFLYVASTVETAIAEVRPHPGQPVSIGKFKSVLPLRVANFANIEFLNFSGTDDKLDDLHLLVAIDAMLREPIPPDKRYLYCLPQLFSDVLRQMGYDAVKFNSSVAKGYNVTVFDPSKFEYIADEAAVHLVQEVRYVFEPQNSMSDPEGYTATQGYKDSEWKYRSM